QVVQFLPVQELLLHKPRAEVVMVDEAAGLPAHWLRDVLLGWPRVAFASTVHGYEGTGRGFSIRFRQVLDRETPHWQAIGLQQPVRWASGDPLERLVSELFLLAADSPEGVKPLADEVVIEPWYPAKANETVLSEAFGLLVDAQYRTPPAARRPMLVGRAALGRRQVLRGEC